MNTQTYQLHLGKDQIVNVELPTDEPLYRIVARLAEQHGLPASNQYNQPIRYGLYAGQLRRLSNEMSLRQMGYDQGGDLYLTDLFAPWWETTPALTRRLETPDAMLPALRRMPVAIIGVTGGGLLILAVVAALLANRVPVPVRASEAVATVTMAPPPAVTATLAPAPSGIALPQMTTALVSTPSPIPARTLAPTPTRRPAAAVIATPALRAVTVAGVNREYANRDARLFFQGRTGFGAYLWTDPTLQTRVPASQGSVVLSNGDEVLILDELGGIFYIQVRTNALDPDDPKVIGVTGYLYGWLITNRAVPPAPPQPTRAPSRLWVRLKDLNDQQGCISIQITGIGTSGWRFTVDGMNLVGYFDGVGNARLCGLATNQKVTITVWDQNNRVVRGGSGVPSESRAIMIAEWLR